MEGGRSTATEVFHCPSCEHEWETLEALLGDPEVTLLGYQVHFRCDSSGFFLFNHLACRTTLGIEAGHFVHLAHRPIFNQSEHAQGLCPQHCLHAGIEEPPTLCDCAFVGEIIERIQNWPKR